MLGDLPLADALRMAMEQGLDLVEVNPSRVPPVCKLMDLAKFLSDMGGKKKRREHDEIINRERSEPGSRFPSEWRAAWMPIAEILMNEWDCAAIGEKFSVAV